MNRRVSIEGTVTRYPILQNPITRLVVLGAFVAGGLAAPAVHRLHHGIEYRDIARDLSMFDGHAHGDEELLSYPLPRTDFRDPYCVLCKVVFEGLEDKGQIDATKEEEPRRIFATSTELAQPAQAYRGRAPPLFV